MKKILLTCLLLIAASTCMFAQTGPTGPTQIDFTNKVNQLMMYLNQNNLPAATITWDEVHDMIIAEFDYVKYRLSDAVATNNLPEQQNMNNLLDLQSSIYEAIILLRDDLVLNQPQLNVRLNDFRNTLL